jgi:hypothetical protein
MTELRPEVRAFFQGTKLSCRVMLDGVARPGGKWGGSIATCAELPRLVRKEVYWYRSQRTVRAWFVDGERVHDLNAAYDRLMRGERHDG